MDPEPSGQGKRTAEDIDVNQPPKKKEHRIIIYRPPDLDEEAVPGEFELVSGSYKYEEEGSDAGEFELVSGAYKYEEEGSDPGEFQLVSGSYKYEEGSDPGEFGLVSGSYKYEEGSDPGEFGLVSGSYKYEEGSDPGEFGLVSGSYKYEEGSDPGEFGLVSGAYKYEEEGSEAVGRPLKTDKLKVQALKTIQGLKKKLMAIPIPSDDTDVIQVRLIPPKDLRSKILKLVNEACEFLDKEEGLYFKLVKGTVRYKADLGYYVACRSKNFKRNVHEANSSKKASVYAGILNWIYTLSHTNNYLPGRMLYYEDENLIKDTTYVYKCIDNLCVHFGCLRATLRVIPASSTGLVFGPLKYQVHGEVISCGSKFNIIPIPNESIIDQVKFFPCGVDFILIVEKETIFTVIKDSLFCNEYNCLLITGRGEADTSTRLFARKLRDYLNVPVFGLMDGNIHGIQIMGVFKHGSMQKALENQQMAIPDLKWIGIHPGDLPRDGKSTAMTEHDLGMCDKLLAYEWVKGNKKLVEKIEHLKVKKKNVEIDQFVAYDYLLKVYLPHKLSCEDSWI